CTTFSFEIQMVTHNIFSSLFSWQLSSSTALYKVVEIQQEYTFWFRCATLTCPGCFKVILSREALCGGCDRAIPNELRSLLPGLRNLRLLLLSHRHGLRSQVPLMDVLPNATQPDHPKVQDDLSACDGP